MAQTATCPQCHYDLEAVPGDSGQCPECGTPFDRGALARRLNASARQALSLLAFGTFGFILAETLARCIGWMPRANEGTAGNSRAAGEWLRLIPVTMFAAGLAMLARVAASSRRLRLACYWIGGAAWVLVLHEAYSSAPGGRYPYSWWLQPQSWRWSTWVEPFVVLAALFLSLALLVQASRGAIIFQKISRVGMAAVFAAAMTTGLLIVFRQLEGFRGPAGLRPGPFSGAPTGPPRDPTFIESGGPVRLLAYFDGMLRTGLWLGVGVLALLTRGIWVRERP